VPSGAIMRAERNGAGCDIPPGGRGNQRGAEVLTATAELALAPLCGLTRRTARLHLVLAAGVEVGAATPARTDASAGLTVRIDDPTFPKPLVDTLNRVDHEEFALVRRRTGLRQ
jgi:uncharacterized protein (DUF736 family)